ncbi:MAG TPA: hypothetical protein VLH56_13885 [Dissulfurispiraceae bacterium]|nr:hypothetical protein [Dissulfurispiraceae bacterium]
MNRRTLLSALFLIALGGFLLHYRIHPFMVPDKANPGMLIFNGTKFLASFFSLVDVIIVTALFSSKRYAMYGYLLNGMLVIYGCILMSHFSIAGLAGKSLPLTDMILRSTIPDIAIAGGDFLIGKALYDSYMHPES